MKVTTEHMGIKYSLQPHGLKSKLFFAFASFVVVFGGALAIAAPAQADPTDPPGTCYVAVTVTPTPTPPASPSTTPSPTACPTAPPPVTTTITTTVTTPVTTTITKKVTVYVNQTTTRTETVMITPSESPSSAAPLPSTTSDPLPMQPASGGGTDAGSLFGWGVATVGVLGVALGSLGLFGIVRGRRRNTGNTGRHHVDNAATTLIPVVRGSSDDHDVYDYGHGDYDPALGGHAGETMQIPAVEPDSSGDADTKPQSPVQ